MYLMQRPIISESIINTNTKMNTIKKFLSLIVITMFVFTACNKDKEDVNTDSKSVQQLTVDQNNVIQSSDDVMNDMDRIVSTNTLKSTQWIPCNATLDSVVNAGDTIIYYVTYHGLNCNNKIERYGNVIVKKPVNTYWIQAGATMSVQMIDLEITRVATGKMLIINGKKVFENVSGGHIALLGSVYTSIVHRTSGYLNATFEDNTTRTWFIARQKVFTGVLGDLIMTVDGFGVDSGYENLSVWGTNRQGEAFFTNISQSIVFKEACNFNPVSGIQEHTLPAVNKSASITYGYDASQQLITNGDCPTHYRIDFQHGTYSGTLYLPL